MPARQLMCRLSHRLVVVVMVLLVALVGSLLAQAVHLPRAASADSPTLEVCSSSGLHRAAPDPDTPPVRRQQVAHATDRPLPALLVPSAGH